MNSLDGVMVIGLTGQTGAGKSTVSKVFVQNGFRLIDADAISRHVVARGSHCLADLQECFTDAILTPDGNWTARLHGVHCFFGSSQTRNAQYHYVSLYCG